MVGAHEHFYSSGTGEENLDLVESIRTSGIVLHIVRHEQAAGFMAATVGRLTGAYPVLFITGQKPIAHSRQGMFQVVNVVDMFRPLTKLSKSLVDGGLVPSSIREACRLAEEERPGPTLLELPEDVARQMVLPSPQLPLGPSRNTHPTPARYCCWVTAERCVLYPAERVRRPIAEDKAIAEAVQLLQEAKHPLLVIGAGGNRKLTSNMLRRMVEQLQLPFCETQMGKGVIDSRRSTAPVTVSGARLHLRK
eukprot:jgi/Botrbrau1/18645/Bobra.0367s0081.1